MSFPVVSFREHVLGSHNVSSDMANAKQFLGENRFTAVSHRSIQLEHPSGISIFHSAESIDNVYQPEIESPVKQITGCKHAFSVLNIVRGPKKAPSQAAGFPQAGQPIRPPHNDSTPLGTRQSIRLWRHDIRDAASKAMILAAEDALYEAHGVRAVDTASEAFEDLYDGPRYATYSIWRPLKKVARDPLAMAHRRDIEKHPDLVFWRYLIRLPGLDGDWLRQLEMVKLRNEATASKALDSAETVGAVGPAWYYLPGQQSDEVLVVQLFDSGSLGPSPVAAGGTAHASPDLGDAGYGDARESAEVRVIAIW